MHAAAAKAHASAETIEVPKVDLTPPRRSRKNTALAIAAGVAVVGAAALAIGVASAPRSQSVTEVAAIPATSVAEDQTQIVRSAVDVADDSDRAEDGLTSRVHDVVSSSLPRIQAATTYGMREGSGLFVTDDGHIATSAGLVGNADYVLAWTQDGQRWRANVIAIDPISDIAVIHIDSEQWPSVSLSSTTPLRTGQYAFALDHDENTISVGEVVSVGGSTVTVDQPAAMPGSAIVDDTGAVIAMVTSDLSQTAATPAWILEQVAVDLIASGETTHMWLGVLLEEHASAEALQVAGVIAGSPADEAGLNPGDIINSMNGQDTSDAATLHQLIQASEPGDEAVLSVTRDGNGRIIIATLEELPG